MNFSDLASKSQSFLFGPGTEAPSYEALKRRREIADLLMKRTMSTQPKNIGEGISMLGQAILARRMDNKLGPQEDAERKSISEALSGLMGGGFTGGGMGGYSGNLATLGASGGSPDYGSAIASIESGGNYGATGPVTKTGDRAYGKYQVMGANIPEWSKAALGQSVTPEQFLSDPKLQDAVFQHRFGQYVQQYGPEGAASAWFSGDPTPDGDKDQLGTSDQSYVDKFKAALGQSGAMPGQAPDMSKIGKIMELMDNPYMSEGQRMVAQAIIQQTLQGADPMRSLQMMDTLSGIEARENAGEMTDYQRQSLDLERQKLEAELANPEDKDPTSVNEYQFAVENGYQGPYDKWLLEVKKAGANNITIGERQEKQAQSAEVSTDTILNAAKTAREISDGFGTTGLLGAVTGLSPASQSAELRRQVEVLKSSASIDTINAMRQASPTGGALGNVTEGEHKLLSAKAGALDPNSAPEDFARQLDDYERTLLRIVNGPQEGDQIYGQTRTADGPQPGLTEDGYRFKGGDPSKPENWEKVE